MKTYKRSILIIVLVIVFSLAGMSSSVFSEDNKFSRETLSITLKKAIDLFDRAHEMVIQKQFFEQRKRNKDL